MNLRRKTSPTLFANPLLRAAFAAVLSIVFFSSIFAGAQSSNQGNTINPYTVTAPGVIGQGQGGAQPQPMQAPSGFGTPSLPTLGPQQGGMGSGAGVFYPDPEQYVLSTGDLINLRLFGSNDYFDTVRISKDGTVNLPLIGSVKLADMTIASAEIFVAQQLKSAQMYQNPAIRITLAEPQAQQTVTLAGEMHAVVSLMAKQRSLMEVLASQGGLPVTAGHTVTIIRPGVDQPILVDVGNTPQEMAKADVPIYPHDTIYVARSGVIFVIGSFRSTGVVPVQNAPMTLMQVAAISGGPLYDAKYDDLRIIRTVGTERSEVKVDIKKVLYGKAPDPLLQAGDIIFLPNSTMKTIIRSGGIGTIFGIVSLLLVTAR